MSHILIAFLLLTLPVWIGGGVTISNMGGPVDRDTFTDMWFSLLASFLFLILPMWAIYFLFT
jgi:hypothetical protein